MAGHELIRALDAAGLAPRRALREMLDEHPSHRTLRRGCGFTQATRLLADYVNRPRAALESTDLELIGEWPHARVQHLAQHALACGWAAGWRCLERCDAPWLAAARELGPVAALAALNPALAAIGPQLQYEESHLFLRMLQDIFSPQPLSAAPVLPSMPAKPEIGSCSQAEEFFLEISHHRIRRGGRVNLVVDAAQRPLLVEKIGLGESHSALAIAPVSICGVILPPGALLALDYPDDLAPQARIASGAVLPVKAIVQARFLRLTTLAVSPAARRRAFSAQLEVQVQSNFLSPETTTLQDLQNVAQRLLASA